MMLHLALVAALLLALMPTVGRMFVPGSLAGADGTGGPCPMSTAMSGMSSMNHMPGMRHTPGKDGQTVRHSAPTGSNHDDCPYCPLLSALAGLAVLMVLLLPQCAACTLRMQWSSPRIVAVHPCGLGSRGPPLAA
jgi:hypothetical protein